MIEMAEMYVMTIHGAKIGVAVFSSRAKLLEGYLKACHVHYRNYQKALAESVRELTDKAQLFGDRTQDILNFIQEKEYEDRFTFQDLHNLDDAFDFHIVRVDI